MVKLQSLEMKSNASVLSSIRCVLSNGISSPVFEFKRKDGEEEDLIHEFTGVVNFGPGDIIRYVQAHDEEQKTISRICFLGEDKQELASYNPFELRRKGPVLKLREEEILIGVYGVLGKEGYFTSFGFIVKAWELMNNTME